MSFEDMMYNDGFSHPQDYMDYLEDLAFREEERIMREQEKEMEMEAEPGLEPDEDYDYHPGLTDNSPDIPRTPYKKKDFMIGNRRLKKLLSYSGKPATSGKRISLCEYPLSSYAVFIKKDALNNRNILTIIKGSTPAGLHDIRLYKVITLGEFVEYHGGKTVFQPDEERLIYVWQEAGIQYVEFVKANGL
jgi:hypothetical protein